MIGRQKRRWRVAEPHAAEAESLAREAGCSPIAAQLLLNRGIADATAAGSFLNPSFEHLPDPFLLPDAEAAAQRIGRAIADREKIAVHGDYDGDGVTSAALWMRLLTTLGADVRVHVPHRKRDGYDMRSKFVAGAKEEGVDLIITSDCGIQRYDEVEEARAAGIDVIITDHHEPGELIPRAIAVVNPHRKDSRYPFPLLAGVGVAFRTGEALVRHLGLPVDRYRRAYVDLAAIGTVTDVMPLLGENRVLVREGLGGLLHTRKAGIRALIASAGLDQRPLTTRDIGFGIGPRLNAAGRVDDSRLALDLLLTRDEGEAAALAQKLERANLERQQEQNRILMEALAQVAELDVTNTSCLVLRGTTWHSGVIGIVANKLVERYNRPTILISADEESGVGRGSARSIGPFNMLSAISACGEHLIEFGGHSHAAGLSMDLGNLDAFRDAMNRTALETLTEEDFIPSIDADLEIDPPEVTLGLMRELSAFEPWGSGNEEPVFVSRGIEVSEARRIGKEQNHLKLFFRTAASTMEGVYWGAGDLADHLHSGDVVDLCYRPRINDFNGRISVQMSVEDLRPAGMDDW